MEVWTTAKQSSVQEEEVEGFTFPFFFFSSFLTTLDMVSPSLTSLSHTLAGGIYYSFPFSLFFWEAVVPREE